MALAFSISSPLQSNFRSFTSRSSPVRKSYSLLTTMKIDSHVHVWDPTFPTHPDHPLPNIVGTADDLISKMDHVGINKTIIVQPINYKFDHTCIQNALNKYPNRFALVALVDTMINPDEARNTLQKLVREQRFCGIRINPNFAPGGFTNETVITYVQEAAKLNIPVALFARPQHLPDVEKLVSTCADTKILLDHFAFCSPGDGETYQNYVLDMGRKYQNLYIKTSAWFRISKEPWPHTDLVSYLRSLIDTFGAERLLIGSDYPFITEQYEYKQVFSLLDEAGIPIEEKRWIEGEAAKQLYKL